MPKLELIVARLEHLDAALEGGDGLSAALGGAEVADRWEVYPDAVRIVRDRLAAGGPEAGEWGTHLFVLARPRTLVGWGGFKGPPVAGEVEIGYSVAPRFEGRGIAGAAVEALLAKAAGAGGVTAVIAHTLPEAKASGRVLASNGFELEDETATEAERAVWRWRRPISRPGA